MAVLLARFKLTLQEMSYVQKLPFSAYQHVLISILSCLRDVLINF